MGAAHHHHEPLRRADCERELVQVHRAGLLRLRRQHESRSPVAPALLAKLIRLPASDPPARGASVRYHAGSTEDLPNKVTSVVTGALRRQGVAVVHAALQYAIASVLWGAEGDARPPGDADAAAICEGALPLGRIRRKRSKAEIPSTATRSRC